MVCSLVKVCLFSVSVFEFDYHLHSLFRVVGANVQDFPGFCIFVDGERTVVDGFADESNESVDYC